MKVVLDTNVLIAAFIAHGVCNEVVEHCFVNHEVVSSIPLLNEFTTVLVGKFKFTRQEANSAGQLLESRSTIVRPLDVSPKFCRDADDLIVLGTALAGFCSCIITGDKDLISVKQHNGISIVSPGSFWQFEKDNG